MKTCVKTGALVFFLMVLFHNSSPQSKQPYTNAPATEHRYTHIRRPALCLSYLLLPLWD